MKTTQCGIKMKITTHITQTENERSLNCFFEVEHLKVKSKGHFNWIRDTNLSDANICEKLAVFQEGHHHPNFTKF